MVTGPAVLRVANGYMLLQNAGILSAFHERYPRVRIQPAIAWGGGVGDTSVVLDLLHAGRVDVVGTGGLLGLALAHGLLLPLDPWLRAGNVETGAFGGLLPQMRASGKLYDLPYEVITSVVVYDAALLQAAAVPVPLPSWTWAQMRGSARALAHGGGNGKVWGLWAPFPSALIDAWLQQTTGGHPGAVTSSQLRACLTFFHDMIFVDHSMPRPSTYPGGPMVAAPSPFASGRAAMAVVAPAGLASMAQGTRGAWGVLPLPRQPTQPVRLVVGVQSLAIAAGTREAESAWALLTFVCGAPGALAVARYGLLPAYRTPAAQRVWLAHAPQGQGTANIFHWSWWLPPRLGAATFPASVSTATQGVLAGRATVATAVAGWTASR